MPQRKTGNHIGSLRKQKKESSSLYRSMFPLFLRKSLALNT
jgi:hypothetical protein